MMSKMNNPIIVIGGGHTDVMALIAKPSSILPEILPDTNKKGFREAHNTNQQQHKEMIFTIHNSMPAFDMSLPAYKGGKIRHRNEHQEQQRVAALKRKRRKANKSASKSRRKAK